MRDTLNYDNTDFMLRQIITELIWGTSQPVEQQQQPASSQDNNNNNNTSSSSSTTFTHVFKLESTSLSFEPPEPSLISYADFLNNTFKPLSEEEYNKLDKHERKLKEVNDDILNQKIQAICDVVEPGHPGYHFKRMYEDMKRKLRVDEKIQSKLQIEVDNVKPTNEHMQSCNKTTPKFTELNENADHNDKFKRIFHNGYYNIIISFYSMLITLTKNKIDYSLVFRFFGHDNSQIKQFIYEFNSFLDCMHPRYCGEFGYGKIKYESEPEKKQYKIDTEHYQYCGVCYRGDNEDNEKMFCGTLEHPPLTEIEELRENIDEFYIDENNSDKLSKGFRDIYMNLKEKLIQNSTFIILDDYSFYINNNNQHGKLFLIDPYDTETLQIFFDSDLHINPNKIDVYDVVTKKKLSSSYVMNKYVVNIEPYRAILDINYFTRKITECINNRKSELIKMQSKETPIIPLEEQFSIENEIQKIPGANYLQMTVLPLLHNALSLCEMIRPQDPIAFIASFMLSNKAKARNLECIVKEMPHGQFEQVNIDKQKGIEEDSDDDVNGDKDEMNKRLYEVNVVVKGRNDEENNNDEHGDRMEEALDVDGNAKKEENDINNNKRPETTSKKSRPNTKSDRSRKKNKV